jgi:hypothetical protein
MDKKTIDFHPYDWLYSRSSCIQRFRLNHPARLATIPRYHLSRIPVGVYDEEEEVDLEAHDEEGRWDDDGFLTCLLCSWIPTLSVKPPVSQLVHRARRGGLT